MYHSRPNTLQEKRAQNKRRRQRQRERAREQNFTLKEAVRQCDATERRMLFPGVKKIDNSQLIPIRVNGQAVELGVGAFGTVSLCTFQKAKVAVKKVRGKVAISRVISEAHYLQVCSKYRQHNNLPILVGVASPPLNDVALLVTHFYGYKHFSLNLHQQLRTTLSTRQKPNAVNTQDNIIRIITDIVSGLSHMHFCNVLHNDLHCTNVLIDIEDESQQVRAVITDFGLATNTTSGTKLGKGKFDIEKYPHISPDVCSGQEKQSIRSDIYSVGYIVQCMQKFKAFLCSTATNQCLDVLRESCLQQIPSKRPTLAAVNGSLQQIWTALQSQK